MPFAVSFYVFYIYAAMNPFLIYFWHIYIYIYIYIHREIYIDIYIYMEGNE